MKKTIRDSDHHPIKVGYEWFENWEEERDEPLFWIESEWEVITLHLTKKDMAQLIKTLTMLMDNLPNKKS